MKEKKKLIDEGVGLIEGGGGQTAQKEKEYRGLAVLGLQMVLYSLRGVTSQEVQNPLDHLLSRCRWLGRLMALNNPPLQPDWKDHTPGMDTWDIFPREIRDHAANDADGTSHVM